MYQIPLQSFKIELLLHVHNFPIKISLTLNHFIKILYFNFCSIALLVLWIKLLPCPRSFPRPVTVLARIFNTAEIIRSLKGFKRKRMQGGSHN